MTQGGLLGSQIYTGIKPASGRNIALVFTLAKGTFGVPEKCVKLHELHFTCTTVDIQSIANVPLGCTLEVEAFGRSVVGQPPPSLGKETFTFTPLIKSNILPPLVLPIYSDMAKAVMTFPAAASYTVRANAIPGFGFLDCFTPTVQEILLGLFGPIRELNTAALFDNITYTTYETYEPCGMGS